MGRGGPCPALPDAPGPLAHVRLGPRCGGAVAHKRGSKRWQPSPLRCHRTRAGGPNPAPLPWTPCLASTGSTTAPRRPLQPRRTPASCGPSGSSWGCGLRARPAAVHGGGCERTCICAACTCQRQAQCVRWRQPRAQVNCAINPSTAILGCRNGALLEPHATAAMRDVCTEVAAVLGPGAPTGPELLEAALQVPCLRSAACGGSGEACCEALRLLLNAGRGCHCGQPVLDASGRGERPGNRWARRAAMKIVACRVGQDPQHADGCRMS